MKIVIDARSLGWTGVGRYGTELLTNLEKLDSTNEYIVMMRRADEHRWHPRAANFRVEYNDASPYTLREQISVPIHLYQLKADMVHFLNPSLPILYFKKHITTIHDLTLVDYKNVRSNPLVYEVKFRIFKLVMWMAARLSAHIITDTQYIADQIAQRYKRKSSDLTAVHLGVGAALETPQSKSKKDGGYLLYVGNFYPYKNIKRLIQALPEIHQTKKDIRLVLVGKEDNFAKELQLYAAHIGVSDLVEFTGFVTDAQLRDLYAEASAYVFPSLSEGFGLPGLEAMSFGTPVLSSNASCLPEVYQDAADYFDPTDAHSIAQAVLDFYDRPARRNELVKAGFERLKSFSWKHTAEQTLKVYNALNTKR